MAVISMKALLESGVHFGHRTNKWHPKMKPYIFTERNGIHIIDLQQTVKAIGNAYNVIRDKAAEGGVVLFVGTKRQAQETVHDEAVRCGMPYVTERWLGGMLTNWTTMRQRIAEMERMEKLLQSEDLGGLTKKEGLIIERQFTRLNIRLGGVRSMARLPDLLFVVDVSREESAVHEANLLEIPVIALVDTNCDPSNVDYIIPSNDDAIRAIKLLVGKIADAVLEGKALRKEEEIAAEEEGKTELIETGEELALGIDEVELEDEDLLGEATLAKLGPSRKAEDEIEEVDEEEEVKKKEEDKKEKKERKLKEEIVQEKASVDVFDEAITDEEVPAAVTGEVETKPDASAEAEKIEAEKKPAEKATKKPAVRSTAKSSKPATAKAAGEAVKQTTAKKTDKAAKEKPEKATAKKTDKAVKDKPKKTTAKTTKTTTKSMGKKPAKKEEA